MPGANQPEKDKQADAGGTSPVSFGFDPDLKFTADVNPELKTVAAVADALGGRIEISAI